jgi:hypothetical protein
MQHATPPRLITAMENGSQFSLCLIRLSEGGYVVQDGAGWDSNRMMMQYFASTSIDEALQFMRDKIAGDEAKRPPPARND